MQENVLSVRQLNFYVRSLLESDTRLCNVLVEGEISNFKNHYSSGHLYFTLKDADSSIRCVMFKANALRLKFRPEDGLKVVLRGRASVYEKDGQYQFYAEEMSVAGFGDIALHFQQIKQRLEKEGMLDPSTKRSLPKFPKSIAVVTSDTGAAIRDILNILERRWPLAKVIVCPVAVQGDLAVSTMLDTLDRIYNSNIADIIIIGRGGGSIEDLWAFNDEQLARKIYESNVPVISAVGHETDFTICDFVADMRAPTPSAAAELAVPDINEFLGKLSKYNTMLKTALSNKYNFCNARLYSFLQSAYFKRPSETIVDRKGELLDRLEQRLLDAVSKKINAAQLSFTKSVSALDALSPLTTLSRGFAAVSRDGSSVNSVASLNVDDELCLNFTDGAVLCGVKEISKK